MVTSDDDPERFGRRH